MIEYGIITHGGAGCPRKYDDGCKRAAQAGYQVLKRGGNALDAVVQAARILEDDGRYNAGKGAALRLDGQTIEMDASLMDSQGRIGVVAAIRKVRNPILVAREVMKTPHVILSGEGATLFARRRGFLSYAKPSQAARERYEKARGLIRKKRIRELREDWEGADLKALWNFSRSYKEVFGSDTIGAVAIDREGLLAVANSTGGAIPMLLGRLGDSPIMGCGFYAGPAAAVAATGIGEEIIRRQAARAVHDRISAGEEVARACEVVVAQFPEAVSVGIIAISRRGAGTKCNREMAQAVCVLET